MGIMIIFPILGVILMVLSVFLIVYIILLVKETLQSIKICNEMLTEVNKELPQMVGDIAKTIRTTDNFTADVTAKIKNATDFLGVLGVIMGGVEGAKNKIGQEIFKQAVPSRDSIMAFMAGIKKGVEVLFAAPASTSSSEEGKG
ncbi:MAG: hypothetical protein NT099_07315 [Candidatus Saganbacteria bacterium]|nr:hypothetical protein [Candidatus Saganbacteria bacterium]